MKSRFAILALVLAQFGITAWGAEDPRRFLAVTNWYATFTRTLQSSGTYTEPATKCVYTWSFSHGGDISSQLKTLIPPLPGVEPVWSDVGDTNIPLNVSIQDTGRQTCGDVTDTYEANDGPSMKVGQFCTLEIDLARTNYTLEPGYVVAPISGTVNGDRFPDTFLTWFPPFQLSTNPIVEPLPASGMILQGSRRYSLSQLDSQDAAVFTIAASGSPIAVEQMKELTGELVLTWTLTPSVEDVEVVVQIPKYSDWTPEGAGDEESSGGDPLALTAKLQQKGGGPTMLRADQFVMELISVSHEPGICMNYPLSARPGTSSAEAKADLRFNKDLNNGIWRLDADQIKAQTIQSNLPAATAYLSSFDWGGYAVLRVTATLADGREVVGHLENEPDTTDIRIPKRKDGSFIADKWKKDNDAANLADNSDDENEPVGDGDRGDGLTLYEEYRGFYAGGTSTDKHICGTPKQKDFFVVNKISTTRGFDLLAAESGLAVHARLQTNEIGADRVINFNHSNGAPHRTDQHAILLERGPLEKRVIGQAFGSPGLPKHITKVWIASSFNLAAPPAFVSRGRTVHANDETAQVVAHELAHCCNVYHHGERPPEGVEWTAARVDGLLTWQENGTDIRVFTDPSLVQLLPRTERDTLFDLIIGQKGDWGSGNESCIMRYPNHAHAWVGGEFTRFFVGDDELIGDTFCTDARGTGVNEVTAGTPWPRYGDAAAGRGRCKFQFCVNDAMNHTPITGR